MDIKNVKTGDLAKIAKLMKADGAKKNSSAAAISKAAKSSTDLKKSAQVLKKLAKTDTDFDK